MKRILLITALAACFSMAWAFGNECSLLQEEESGFCGNPDVNMGMNLCYVVTNENDVKTLTIFRNPDAEGDDFGIAVDYFSWWDFSVLVIEEGVTSIGSGAFYGCGSLTTATFPDGLVSIGQNAFRSCSSLTTLTFPDGLTSIGPFAFEGCSGLTTVTFPDGLISIGESAFEGCSSLTTATFSDGLTSIGEYAFYGCSSLTTVTFSEGLTSIGQRAFESCSSLTTVTFSDGLTSIGQRAFYMCESLTTVTLPEGLTSIGEGAFMYCENLSKATLPAGLTSIGQAAFFGCESLTMLTFPSSLTSIGENAFGRCTGVTDIYCLASPTQLTWNDADCDDFKEDKATLCHVMDENTWSSFEGNVNVTFVGDLGEYCGNLDANNGMNVYYVQTSENGVKTITIYKNPDAEGDDFGIAESFFNSWDFSALVIKEGVTSIGRGAFWGCESLTTVTLPNGLTSIGEGAFFDCSSLTTLTLPDGLTSIGQTAFKNCKNLITLIFPNSLTSIGESAFEGCTGVTDIYCHASPTRLTWDSRGYEEFKADKATLCHVMDEYAWHYFEGNVNVTFVGDLGEYCGNLYVNEGKNLYYVLTSENGVKTLTIYKNPDAEGDDFGIAENFFCVWDFSVLVIKEGVTSIGMGAFWDCESLTTVTLPNGLISIEQGAFSDCSGLKTVTFHDGLTSIGQDAFSGCSSLTTVTFPTGLTSIGQRAFSGCSSLTTATFSDGLTSIVEYAFSGCSSLTTLTFPSSLTSIGESAFNGCESLTTLTFPDGLTSIGQDAFRGCESLTTATFPDGLTSIGQGAFLFCENLSKATFPGSLTSIGQDAFNGCNSLTTLNFPSSLTSIGENAFWGCTGVTDVYCFASPTQLTWNDEGCDDFKEDKATLCHVMDKSAWSSFEGNVNVTFVGGLGYCGNPSVNEGKNLYYILTSENDVKTLTISKNPNAVGDDFGIAENFFSWWDFSVLVIEEGVTSIGSGAFYCCENLTTVTFHDGLTSIGQDAFYNCSSLTTLAFPAGLTSIGQGAFYQCGSLATVTFPDGLTSIERDAFYRCSSLTTLAFPDGLTSIGQSAFNGCSSLTTLAFPDGLTSIAQGAFSGCSSLTTLAFPDGLTSIGQDAFRDCNNLTTVTFPDGLVSIGQGAFYQCGSLATVTFPEGLASIGQNAFAGCWSLTTLAFTNGLSSIGQGAFYHCPDLTTVTLPSSLTLIDKDAFLECSGITDIYCYAVPTQLTWDDNFCDDFMGRRSEKATRCHVYDEGDWSSFGNVNVTFVGDLPVVLEKNGDNSDLVAYPPTKAKDVTLADRFFIMDGSWNTLCLPFSLSSLEGTPLEGFTVKELDTESDEYGHRTGMEGETLYLYFKDANGIEAGKPYLVKKEAGGSSGKIPVSAQNGTRGRTDIAPGSYGYNFPNLLDGNMNSKWRTVTSDGKNFCEFEASEAACVTRYEIISTNLQASTNPKVWTLKGKLNKEDEWTVIDSRDTGANPGDALETGTKTKSYTIAADKQGVYKYFRFDVTELVGGTQMVVSELTLYGTTGLAIENPVFPGITISNSPAATVTSEDGTVTFAGSYKPIGGSSQLCLGTDNRLFHLADGKKMGALHAAFFMGQVNSAGNRVGDVNGDGSVDISDAMVLVNKILTDASGISDVTDLNSNNRVGISDVVWLVNKILNPDPGIKVTTIVSNVDIIYDESGSGSAR